MPFLVHLAGLLNHLEVVPRDHDGNPASPHLRLEYYDRTDPEGPDQRLVFTNHRWQAVALDE